MKIYTKKGDAGKTSIIGESNIYKNDIRIEAYGTIDELNSYLGLLRSFESSKFSTQKKELMIIQNSLFNIGATLASKKVIPECKISNKEIRDLEHFIDQIESKLNPLKSFILPGGELWSSYAQIARSVCRRAERNIISLNIKEGVDPLIIMFMNRLSDYLFVLARYISFLNNVQEIKWNAI
tara:strand:+ start:34 stop:576 length:543 start_codon:yes stop_codon:yes gene_type:complete